MTSSSSSEPELKSEQEVIARFQDMRRQLAALVSNLQSLEAGECVRGGRPQEREAGSVQAVLCDV